MKVTCLIHTRPDGAVFVTHIAPALIMEYVRYGKPTGTLVWTGEPRDEPGAVLSVADAVTAAIGFVRAKDIPADSTDTRVEEGDCVGEVIRWSDGSALTRRFRSCYRRTGMGLPMVDMGLARTQRMNEVRTERKPKLEKSDVNLLRAQEQGNIVMQNNLKIYRQQLRDLPTIEQPKVDACTTPEQLAAWNPTWPIDPV